MFLIKQWLTRGGITARFYMSNGLYFIDYNGCTETAQVFVTMTGIHMNVAKAMIMESCVPRTYKQYINKWVHQHLSVKAPRAPRRMRLAR